MKAHLVFDDWRTTVPRGPKILPGESIYNHDLGLRLSEGELHSGTTWDVEIVGLPDDIAEEIRVAREACAAVPVFTVYVNAEAPT